MVLFLALLRVGTLLGGNGMVLDSHGIVLVFYWYSIGLVLVRYHDSTRMVYVWWWHPGRPK